MNTALLRADEECVAIRDTMEEYVLDCQVANQSRSSIETKRYTLFPAADRFMGQGITEMRQLTTPRIKEYLRWLMTAPSPRTGRLRTDVSVRSAAVIIKGWLRWAYAKRYVDAERLQQFIVPKAKKASVYMPSLDDISRLYAMIDDFWSSETHPEIKYWSLVSHKFFSQRMRVILSIAISSGLRIGEILSLRLSDYDQKQGILTARKTKNGKTRGVPVGKECARAVAAWLKVRPSKCPTDFLIVTETGGKMPPTTCSRQFGRYQTFAKKRGVDMPRITIHSLRHLAISSMLQINAEHARIMAGHASVTTTQQIYGHTVLEDVRVSHAKSDPLERIWINSHSVKVQEPRRKKIFSK